MSWVPGWGSVAGTHWWSNVYFAASIGALILLGVFEVVSHRYGERRDELAAIEREAADKDYNKQLGELHDRATKAEVRAGELATEVARANERTADLEHQTAEARSDAAQANERAAKIQLAAAWRIIDPAVKSRIAIALAATAGGPIEISWPANDPEALFLAYQTEDIFKEANARAGRQLWIVTMQPRVFSRQIFFKTRIFGPADAVVAVLRQAFNDGGISTIADAVPTILNDSPGMQIGGGGALSAMIFVGSKPPPNWPP